jgi:hypothetical protein
LSTIPEDQLRAVIEGRRKGVDLIYANQKEAAASLAKGYNLPPDIAASALVVGMADRYCAAIGARNYRRSLLPPDALRRLAADNAGHPGLISAFTSLLGDYPPGTLVRLADGAAGVVRGRQPQGVSVHVLRDGAGQALDEVRADATIVSAVHEDDARLRFSMKSIWGELAAL